MDKDSLLLSYMYLIQNRTNRAPADEDSQNSGSVGEQALSLLGFHFFHLLRFPIE